MTPADLRQNPQAVEEPRSSLHALLELPSCIYAPSRAEEPEKLAKIALSSETWVKEVRLENPGQKQVPFRWYFFQNGKRDGIDLLKDFTQSIPPLVPTRDRLLTFRFV